ncbi:MAG: hypothetical protein PUA96_05320 [Bacteroidales bacterium]|nr:hypothetical protein [Bacteroidales bacterium]
MERKDYVSIRFRQDFLKFSLLQDDSKSAEAIADALVGSFDLKELVGSGERKIKELCDKYFAVTKLRDGDGMTDTLPAGFEWGIHDTAADEFRDYLSGENEDAVASGLIAELVRKIEMQVWSNGVSNMEAAVSALQNALEKSAGAWCESLGNEALPLDDLKKAYENAKRKTIKEKLNGGNYDDIVEYRSLLQDYVKRDCQNLLRAKVGRIYHLIAVSPELERIRGNFAGLCGFADELRAGLPPVEKDEVYEAEYNKLVPAEFYCRNVETITPEFAFQMVLLYFFARNESWLTENGLLSDGRLKVFTGPAGGVRLLLDKLVTSLF